MKHCSLCIHVGETWADPDPEWDDTGLYECKWNTVLPYTWRYCRREVMGAHGSDAEQCLVFQPQEEK
jgi:hypothetical protein